MPSWLPRQTQETLVQFSLHTDLPNSFVLPIRQAYKIDLNLSLLCYHNITSHINSPLLYFPYCQSPCSFALDNKFPKANSSGNCFIFHSISSFSPAIAGMRYKYFLSLLDDSIDHLPCCYSPPKNCSFPLASSLYSQVSGFLLLLNFGQQLGWCLADKHFLQFLLPQAQLLHIMHLANYSHTITSLSSGGLPSVDHTENLSLSIEGFSNHHEHSGK